MGPLGTRSHRFLEAFGHDTRKYIKFMVKKTFSQININTMVFIVSSLLLLRFICGTFVLFLGIIIGLSLFNS